jgi:hypothetical protein
VVRTAVRARAPTARGRRDGTGGRTVTGAPEGMLRSQN